MPQFHFPFWPFLFQKALLQLIEAWKQKLSSRENSPANAGGAGVNPALRSGVTIDEAFAPDYHIPDVKIRTLKGPFIKFDDVSGLHRPVFAELHEWPTIHLSDRPSTFSPFVKNGIGGRGEDKSEADVEGEDARRKKDKKIRLDDKARKAGEGATTTTTKKTKKDIKERAKEVRL